MIKTELEMDQNSQIVQRNLLHNSCIMIHTFVLHNDDIWAKIQEKSLLLFLHKWQTLLPMQTYSRRLGAALNNLCLAC